MPAVDYAWVEPHLRLYWFLSFLSTWLICLVLVPRFAYLDLVMKRVSRWSVWHDFLSSQRGPDRDSSSSTAGRVHIS